MIIGLTGRAGTGKDTAALHLEREHGFISLAFADPLRAMLSALLPYTPVSSFAMHDRAQKEMPQPFLGGASVRRCLQTLGTEWGRELIDGGLWINICRHRIETIGGRIVVTDVRFDNEAQMIRELGGHIVNITREQARPVENHTSEAGITDRLIDYHVDNSGLIGELYHQLDTMMLRKKFLAGAV